MSCVLLKDSDNLGCIFLSPGQETPRFSFFKKGVQKMKLSEIVKKTKCSERHIEAEHGYEKDVYEILNEKAPAYDSTNSS